MVRPCVARRFRRPGGERSCVNDPASAWSALCSRPSWISARMRLISGQASTGAFGSPVFACASRRAARKGSIKAGRRAGLPLASMLPGHALTEAQQVLHARCNWPLKAHCHYTRRFRRQEEIQTLSQALRIAGMPERACRATSLLSPAGNSARRGLTGGPCAAASLRGQQPVQAERPERRERPD